MNKLFDVVFLDDAYEFLKGLKRTHYEKIIYNIRKAQVEQNILLFKKLHHEIWEFRVLYQGIQYRLLAFWDKSSRSETLVIATHGFIKKQEKTPDNEILKARKLRIKYFDDKIKNNKK